jgi:hypothetical protein
MFHRFGFLDCGDHGDGSATSLTYQNVNFEDAPQKLRQEIIFASRRGRRRRPVRFVFSAPGRFRCDRNVGAGAEVHARCGDDQMTLFGGRSENPW